MRCKVCSKEFVKAIHNQVFCSKNCNHVWFNKLRKEKKSIKWKNIIISCKNCLRKFQPGSQYKQAKFCSKQCQQKWWNKHNYGENISKGISPGTIGAIAELAVSVDLMQKGFEVYRALSPSSKGDILAVKNGKTFPIEVKSGYLTTTGTIQYPKHSINAPYVVVYSHVKNAVYYITPLS